MIFWLSALEIIWRSIGSCGDIFGYQTKNPQIYLLSNRSELVIYYFQCHGVQGVEGSNPFIPTRDFRGLRSLP